MEGWLDKLIRELEGKEYHQRVKQLARNPTRLREALKDVRAERDVAMAERDTLRECVKMALAVIRTERHPNPGSPWEVMDEFVGYFERKLETILEGRDDKAETPPAPVGKDS